MSDSCSGALTIIGMKPLIKGVNRNFSVFRKPEMLLRLGAPLQLVKRQIAVPRTHVSGCSDQLKASQYFAGFLTGQLLFSDVTEINAQAFLRRICMQFKPGI